MNVLSALLKKSSWPILASFVLWIYFFRGYVFNHLALEADAIQYYRQIEVYFSNLMRGVYPLWDPSWFNGVPTEFFLRRFGNYNPIFYLIPLLHKAGLTFRISYLWLLTFYYFIGMTGFYLIAVRILKERLAAFFAFAVLLFSSLSTMLFFSFIVLIIVPYFWFFYFLIAFSQEYKKHQLLGCVFCLMIILTTYIPFYFVTIVASFMLFYVICFAAELKGLFSRYVDFLKTNKLFVLLCSGLIFLSVLPGYAMYKNASSSEVALPARHTDPSSDNIFSVGERKIKGGDIASQLYFDRLFSNHENMELGVVYVPAFAFVIALLGLMTRLNRLNVLLAVWAFVVLVIALTSSTSLYKFLSLHVFFFKIIRQSYFFFWIMVLPTFVLLISSQLKSLLNYKPSGKTEIYAAGVYIFLAHAVLAVFLISQKAGGVTLAVVGFSLVVCGWIYFLKVCSRFERPIVQKILPWVVLMLIALPCAHVYHHLSRHGQIVEHPEKDNLSDFSFKYQRSQLLDKSHEGEDIAIQPTEIYYCARWYCHLYMRMDHQVLMPYANNVFVLYDHVRFYDNDEVVMEEFERSLRRNDNTAYVFGNLSEVALHLGHDKGGKPIVPTADSEEFIVLQYNANTIKFKTGFSQDKFLVYNDSFHSGWHARINAVVVPIYRSNVAFKGINLPAGENVVEFYFLSGRHYAIEYFYVVLFLGVFVALVWLWVRAQRKMGYNP